MRKTILSLLLCCAASLSAQDMRQVDYTPSKANIGNPERGFFVQMGILGAGRVIDTGSLSGYYNNSEWSFRLIQFMVKLNRFIYTDITDEFLSNLEKNFVNFRATGMKCILRFEYSDSDKDPAFDAPPEVVQRHIRQLEPIMRRNADVIAAVEAGFIGAYGEWALVTHFKAATSAEYWAQRRQLVMSLLDALPDDRFVLVRTPNYKTMILGITVNDVLTEADAYKGTYQSRIGGHNDAFLWNGDDGGTFGGDKAKRAFWEKDTKYTPMGGETGPGPDDFINIPNATKQFGAYHWSYLNHAHSIDVVNTWKGNGFIDTVRQHLGYRFQLNRGEYTAQPQAGQPFRLKLHLSNVGWAAPFNPRLVEVVFTKDGTEALRVRLDEEPRFWYAGENHTVDATFTLPEDLEAGNYQVDLDLPDPYETLYMRPEYSIRLANEGTWNAATGRNHLTDITVGPANGAVREQGETTGVQGLQRPDDARSVTTYDLQGRPVQNAGKGIYIINGRKVLVK